MKNKVHILKSPFLCQSGKLNNIMPLFKGCYNPRKLKPSYRKGVSNYLSCRCRDMVRPKMATFQMRIFISSLDFDGLNSLWKSFLYFLKNKVHILKYPFLCQNGKLNNIMPLFKGCFFKEYMKKPEAHKAYITHLIISFL
jgi:hypothetical protein